MHRNRTPRRCWSRRSAPALALVAGLVAAAPAGAWGAAGHRIVGRVAEELLDGRTRQALGALAGDESLADIGLWLDRQRDLLRATQPGSAGWHYDNRPVCGGGPGPCPHGDCASHVYARELAVLADRAAPRPARLEALRVVVHVLADVHQPLHAADNRDRGGNALQIASGRRGRGRSLHGAWDDEFVRRAAGGDSERAFARRLVRSHRADLARVEAGGLDEWMGESQLLARDFVYGRLPGFACGREPRGPVVLPPGYADAAGDIVAERLARAGIRLASVLRSTL